MQEAIFAAGCFWGVQYYFDQIPGVIETVVGYTGGHTKDPTYEDVCTGQTGHAEAVRITYDPNRVSYDMLLRHFFRMHDPTQLNRQGPDIGDQYRSAIFYTDDVQRQSAEEEKSKQQAQTHDPIVTVIAAAGLFYPAEDYHQRYTERTGRGMCHVAYQPLE